MSMLLALGATAEGWVTTSGLDSPACESTALANAVHVLRPRLPIHVGESTDASSLAISFGRSGDGYELRVRNKDVSSTRVFHERDCQAAIVTAALIVDGLLDEWSPGGNAPRIDALANPPPPSRLAVGISAGGAVEQGLVHVDGALLLGVGFRLGLLEWAVDGEFLPASTLAEPNHEWTWQSVSGVEELSFGIAPRIGPGFFSADATAGVTETTVSVIQSSLLDLHPTTVATAFVGLWAGYTLDLPARLFLSTRIEERLAPGQAIFAVQGAGSSIPTREWTVTGALVLGWRLR